MDGQTLAFGRRIRINDDLTDQEFLKSVAWANDAPRPLVDAAKEGDVEAFGLQLKKHCLGFRKTARSKSATSHQSEPLQSLWSRDESNESSRTVQLMTLLKSVEASMRRSSKKAGVAPNRVQRSSSRRTADKSVANGKPSAPRSSRIRRWLNAVDASEPLSPFELLVLLEMLLRYGRDLASDDVVRVWRAALTASIAISGNSTTKATSGTAADRELLVCGELPWQASLLFAPVKGSAKLGRAGRDFLSKQLRDKTDTDGTPNAELADILSVWLAPFVRAAQWAKEYRAELWDKESSERFRSLVTTIAPFCRTDGHFGLGNGHSRDVVSLLTTASILAGYREKSPPLQFLKAVSSGAAKRGRRARGDAADSVDSDDWPVTQSDWARLACLRNNWAVDADTLLVAHHREKPTLDLTALGRPLISGPWDIEVAIDGNPMKFGDDWTCSCWCSDEDADFLELHMEIGQGVGIDRQLLLSRTDHFVLLADVVTAPQGARIDYVSRLPLADNVSHVAATETRDYTLKSQGCAARAIPVALPVDRVSSTAGHFGADANGLQLKQVAMGGLYAPLVIDWAPEHRRCRANWRTLTITEQSQVLKSEAACGHRLQIGDLHLLIYRSITQPTVPRAVLGHHTSNETVVGRVASNGEVEAIVLVE